jgi:hypothetical protein
MLQALIALVFVFFLPGFLIVNALFPRKGELDPEYDMLYRITLGIVMSVALTIFVGFGLNSLGLDPTTNMGYFQAPYIWATLIILSILFFVIGWYRGAYPFMGRIRPSLYRLPPRDEKSTVIYKKEDTQKAMELKELAAKRQKVKKQLAYYEKQLKDYAIDNREMVEKKRDQVRNELKSIDKRINDIETDIIGELY